MTSETVWTFTAGRFEVALQIVPEYGYQYDGDDPEGEVQSKLDSGEYIAFGSIVTVSLDGVTIGEDSLWGSVYDADDQSEFWTAHRTSPPEYRNTLAQRAHGRVICHYFPDMVASAVGQARAFLKGAPAVRGEA